ncbi:hypothetical protein A2U01_0081391, partial [Trifolium medium]|nr:hypothetical protein [Trifolium medium]
KSAGKSLGRPADIFPQENPQEKSKFLVVDADNDNKPITDKRPRFGLNGGAAVRGECTTGSESYMVNGGLDIKESSKGK